VKQREFITLIGGAAAAWPLRACAQQSAIQNIGGVLSRVAVRRRHFIATLGGAAAFWRTGAWAQQRVRVVGVLASQPLPPVQRFIRKLREYGYLEDDNLRLHSRFAEGRDDRYPDMAAELVNLQVEVIVTWGTPAAVAAQQASRIIPIVMGAIGDPLSVGLVPSLARPSGNITGFAAQNVDLEGKRLELLKDVLPSLSRVAVLANASNPLLAVGLQKLRLLVLLGLKEK
jgi:putative tryptophan/tyrosine transport system substrate-binding protein